MMTSHRNPRNSIRSGVLRFIHSLSDCSAEKPTRCLSLSTLFSSAVILIGVTYNLNTDVDNHTAWVSSDSRSIRHGKWIENDSGFSRSPQIFKMLVHAENENVISLEGIRCVFEAIDVVRNTSGYSNICTESISGVFDSEGNATCPINAVTRFWNNSISAYDRWLLQTQEDLHQTNNSSNLPLQKFLSKSKFPDGDHVNLNDIIGHGQRQGPQELVTFARSFLVTIEFPAFSDALESRADSFQRVAISNILDSRSKWKLEDENKTKVEVLSENSIEDEILRSIKYNLPLVPLVFVIMSIFCVLVFSRKDKIQSRSLLGFGVIVSVAQSLMAGYGLMFIAGVPISTVTQLLPFVVFAIGVDDAFIIMGAYKLSDPRKTAQDRIHDTMDEVGVSIFLTTITSILAFVVGYFSAGSPILKWFCLYAIFTILFTFIYQVTFFVALLVLDDARMKSNRRGCLVCLLVHDDASSIRKDAGNRTLDSVMVWYSTVLTRPLVKVIVIVSFAALLVGLTYSASKSTQAFDAVDLVPEDSYTRSFVGCFRAYFDQTDIAPYAYFRNVDQSDPYIQDEMEKYMDNLNTLEQVSNMSTSFWLRDFKDFVLKSNATMSLDFNELVALFLGHPIYSRTHKNNIVLDDDRKIIASRARFFIKKDATINVQSQIATLNDIDKVTAHQAVNLKKGKSWSFFTFHMDYYPWEMYREAVRLLILTASIGILCSSCIAFIFVPHWSGCLFIAPSVAILYVELLGFVHLCGVPLNSMVSILMVMSIGLMVDYIMHPALRYYESSAYDRQSKTKKMLTSIGPSILLGGASSMLGVIPLAFASNDIFYTLFVIFMGLVALGLMHGLILLPTLLYITGPEGHFGSTTNKTNESSVTDFNEESCKEINSMQINDVVDLASSDESKT